MAGERGSNSIQIHWPDRIFEFVLAFRFIASSNFLSTIFIRLSLSHVSLPGAILCSFLFLLDAIQPLFERGQLFFWLLRKKHYRRYFVNG